MGCSFLEAVVRDCWLGSARVFEDVMTKVRWSMMLRTCDEVRPGGEAGAGCGVLVGGEGGVYSYLSAEQSIGSCGVGSGGERPLRDHGYQQSRATSDRDQSRR